MQQLYLGVSNVMRELHINGTIISNSSSSLYPTSKHHPPPTPSNLLSSPDFPILHSPGSWQSLLHDPSNSPPPRSRLIP
ncbi:hypothetical protein VN97_g3009, partial [Penicillium thymicola]